MTAWDHKFILWLMAFTAASAWFTLYCLWEADREYKAGRPGYVIRWLARSGFGVGGPLLVWVAYGLELYLRP